ncbi:helix-turn-helix domain-containing protein [Parafrankia discariae]|uniref:helix-turn-helix domain-containing protein n=1 Tax=Parafrankia discariae TaxID=365528 RepID=UPI0003A80AD5
MSRRATAITLTDDVRAELTRRARSATVPRRDWLRARIVLAADGAGNTAIAAGLGVCADTAGKWRGRFAAEGLGGLADRPRSGRPARFSAVQVAEIKAVACTRPADVLDGHLVASTLVTVPALAQPSWLLEIAVVAAS